jgi:hypothetical protein
LRPWTVKCQPGSWREEVTVSALPHFTRGLLVVARPLNRTKKKNMPDDADAHRAGTYACAVRELVQVNPFVRSHLSANDPRSVQKQVAVVGHRAHFVCQAKSGSTRQSSAAGSFSNAVRTVVPQYFSFAHIKQATDFFSQRSITVRTSTPSLVTNESYPPARRIICTLNERAGKYINTYKLQPPAGSACTPFPAAASRLCC